MEHTRLLVLEDIFESRDFATCTGTADRTAEAAQINWLRTQLTDARTHNEHVWLMSHIPPGIDVYSSSAATSSNPPHSAKPLHTPTSPTPPSPTPSSTTPTSSASPSSGHTHMDEIRLLHRPASTAPPTALSSRPERSVVERPAVASARAEGTSQSAIPAKLVPSVTPYAGNHPAFLVATVDPGTAILKRLAHLHLPRSGRHHPALDRSLSLHHHLSRPGLLRGLRRKTHLRLYRRQIGQSPESIAFRQHFYPGDIGLYALGLAQIWPAFACSAREYRPSAVGKCVCTVASPANADAQ